VYNAPHSAQRYLQEQYGYLGENAVFDQETGRYVKGSDVA